ncbi:MAG: hypothetical protein PVF83_07225 [Anaerolineales bacterium]|jgi:hypothetical protein
MRQRQGGRGSGRGTGKRGRKGGNKAGGPGGYCVCPQCNHRMTHTTGQPCYEIKCPKCGTEMVRD